jgi:hypothetical protein
MSPTTQQLAISSLVIYFYHSPGMPLFALTAFAKNERADLSQQDRNDLRQLTTLLVKTFKRKIS